MLQISPKRAIFTFPLIIVLFLTSACGETTSSTSSTLGVGFKPLFSPIAFFINTDGSITIQGDLSFETPIGEVVIEASASSTLQSQDNTLLAKEDDTSLIVVIRHKQNDQIVDDGYKIQTGQDEVRVTTNGITTIDVTAHQVFIDASKGSIQSIEVKDANPGSTPTQSSSTSSVTSATFPCSRGVVNLAWSPHQPYLAVTCSNGTNPVNAIVDVWNVETKQKILILPGDDITAVAWSPDGTKLAMGLYASRTIKVLSLSGQTLLTIPEVSDTDIAWSPDGKYIFGGGNYPVIIDSSTGDIVQRVWETRNLGEQTVFGFLMIRLWGWMRGDQGEVPLA
jgi:WD40 repeat protein